MNKHKGSSFDDFLKEDGIYEEVQTTAANRVLAWQLAEAMRISHITKNKLAKLMNTSRSQVDRLLDPTNTKVQVSTLQRAAAAVGRELVIELK